MGGAPARDRRPAGERGRALPVRVLGRAAPAHRHRARDRAAPEAGAVRRAGVGARRLDPEPDPQPAARSAARAGFSYLFVSHDLAVVKHVSDRIAVMYLGRIVEIGDADAGLRCGPSIPTRGCCWRRCPCPIRGKRRRLEVVEGDVPTPINPPSGCHFHPRCPHAEERCRVEYPVLREVGEAGGPSQRIACHFDL